MNSIGLTHRLTILALVFTLELVPFTIWLDGASLAGNGAFLDLLGVGGAWLVRALVGFALLLVAFSFIDRRRVYQDVSTQLTLLPQFDRRFLAGHCISFTALACLAGPLFAHRMPPEFRDLGAVACVVAGSIAIATGALAIVPLHLWRMLWRGTGSLWICALATSVAACILGAYARQLWVQAAGWTFVLVRGLLSVFLPRVFVDMPLMSIGTQAFHVEIAPQCSGLEGAGLILCFSVMLLWMYRRDFRFPQAFLVVPVSIGILFFCNALRIVILILIGNAGAPDIATGGFHSQAGWIAFNCVAIGVAFSARRVPWIAVAASGAGTAPSLPAPVSASGNPAAPYLVPFLAILASAMISRAFSAGFEWLYPLKVLAAAGALWYFRERYKPLDWRFGWEAPLAGALVFALWMAGDWVTGTTSQDLYSPSPNVWTAVAQKLWLVFRLLGSIASVPIAEELAFRGLLLRRIVSPDFESLSMKTFSLTSLLVSSAAFGVLHGGRWMVGTIAGLIYAAVLIRRGRIGDAAVAHATTNALLAASVLVTGHWNLS